PPPTTPPVTLLSMPSTNPSQCGGEPIVKIFTKSTHTVSGLNLLNHCLHTLICRTLAHTLKKSAPGLPTPDRNSTSCDYPHEKLRASNCSANGAPNHNKPQYETQEKHPKALKPDIEH